MSALPIALIEDQPLIRETLHGYLCEQPEFRCVLTVASVEEFLAGLTSAPEPPALVLSDIGLPGLSGIAGIPLIKARLPAVDILMLSVYTDAERVFQAICAGAVGYLVKSTPLEQLKEHLLQVAAGGSPMSPAVARHVIRSFQAPVVAVVAPLTGPKGEQLTPREQEIVQGIEDGLSYKLIADRMGISVDTVRNFIRLVYRKLHVNSKGEIMALALKRRG
ncbi:response regulator transcription factor [Hymenobacter guriensis]|uniref:Response regulator transcription factor n=1 Tax=Hymenobacter guriensis TaxID=2793065 RepID=A0ABS0KYJ9_9BACT|nr:response regulator transcription factor [Hymenobacter guriensis]MBG8552197.1 response regulator transcription factor [Hymenobacter guriensis]